MALSGNNQASIDGLLKDYYLGGAVTVATFQDHPAWTMVTKLEGTEAVEGRRFLFAVIYSAPQSRNTDFATAQQQSKSSQQGSMRTAAFAIYQVPDFEVARIATSVMLSAKTNRGAFANAVTEITDLSLENLGNIKAQQIFGGGGKRATIATGGITGNTITFSSPGDVNKIEVGQILDLYNGAAKRPYGSNGHGLYVGYVNTSAGTVGIVNAAGTNVNVTDAADGIPTAAAGDNVYLYNDYGNTILGFEDWIPMGGPGNAASGATVTPEATGGTFNGVNRTIAANRLAGNWLDLTGTVAGQYGSTRKSLEEGLVAGALLVQQNGGKPIDAYIVPFSAYTRLINNSQARRIHVNVEYGDAVIGFDGIEINANGIVKVFPDRMCAANRAFGLRWDSWQFKYWGPEPVYIWDLDGNMSLRSYDDDGVELRINSLGNLCCKRPQDNITLGISP